MRQKKIRKKNKNRNRNLTFYHQDIDCGRTGEWGVGKRNGRGWDGEMGGEMRGGGKKGFFACSLCTGMQGRGHATITCTAVCDSGHRNHKTTLPESQTVVHVIVV